jgi:pectate lyase
VAIAVLGFCDLTSAQSFTPQGFGAATSGGAGGAVVRVTNLNDAGPGSLREAVSGSNRTIVFDVAGDIQLSNYLYLRGSNLTIDGTTAPAPGITLRGHGLAIHGTHTNFFSCGNDCHGVHDVIVRHLRIRGAARDGIRIAHNARRIVLDHVSVHGSGDGNLDIAESEDVTVQWSIFAEPALDQKNSLIKYGPRRITLHHNLFTHARQRNPQIRIDDPGTSATETTVDMRNNVIFDWQIGYGTLVWHGPWANVVANYYGSPASAGGVQSNALEVSDGARAYVAGNVFGDAPAAGLNAIGTESAPFPAPAVTTTSACTAAAAVLQSAGVRPLDTVDDRYVDAVALAGCSGGGTPPPPPPPGPSVADLSVSGLTAPGSATAGAALTVGVTTRNTGTAGAGGSATRLYLSKDTAVDAADVVLGEVTVPPLAAGAAATQSVSATVPPGTAAGAYRIVARADVNGAVAEGSEANNTTSLAFSVTAPIDGTCRSCDITVKSVTAPRTAAPGGSFTGGALLTVRGTAPVPATVLRFYLSRERDGIAGAVQLASVPVPALAGGASTTLTSTLTVPAGTSSGTYYLIAVADAGAVAVEVNERNNLGSRAITIK